MAKLLSCIISFITLLLLQSSLIDAQNNGTVPVNQSLTATTNGSPWVSPSNDFAFGFHQFNNTTDLFLLAIWYVKKPNTIVWYANEGNPVPQNSTVTLTEHQGLVLSNPRGSLLWNSSNSNKTVGISYGYMNDTGNFALKTSDDKVVWESFGYPTDTLLPTQEMEIGGVDELDSRVSPTNFTKGRFQLRLLGNGNVVLNTRDLATNFAYGAYYASNTDDATNPGQKVIYDKTGYMYILTKNGSKYDLLPQSKAVLPGKGYYQRATLNFDGVLTWYYIDTTSSGSDWNPILNLPDNICSNIGAGPDTGSGPCGYNSICTLGNDQRPICQCPQNYSLMEPNDAYSNCQPDFIPEGCEGDWSRTVKGEYTLVSLPYTDWPQEDYARLDPCSQEECTSSCLDDCFCAAAIFSGGSGMGSCWKKKLPLTNGRYDNTVSRTAWLKVGNGTYSTNPLNPSAPSIIKEKNKKNVVLSGLLGGSVFVNICLFSAIALGFFLIYRKQRLRWLDGGKTRTFREYSTVTCFDYKELKDATNGFKEEIGRGAFGIVYKGKIGAESSQHFIAVKKLDRISEDADKEFKTEVNAIGQTHHKNLVRLIGFCKEEDQRLLVYEYMSNSTLANYLFGDSKPRWMTRIQIAMGIARGILYLHEECNTQIIHCDIKPQNILLDDYHNARISDFGLAKLLILNQTQTNTAIKGTKGYVAPEWFRNKPVTVKVDVYSFGVLLLEIICSRKNICMEMITEEKAILTDWAFDCYQYGRIDSLVQDDMEALNDRQHLEQFVLVALWCIQEDPSLRPTMRRVTQMLEGLAEVPNPPYPASFTITTK